MSASQIFRRLAWLAASLLIAVHCGHTLAQPRVIDRLVIFGGSLSDTGNAFVWLSDPVYQTCGTRMNVPPYDKLDDLLVPDGPYAKGGHHFTNGATWAEGLARQLTLAGNARPALQSSGKEASNYAVGGSRAVHFPCRFNLPDQLGAYLAAFPRTSPQTLVALEIGGNDVRDALVAAASGQDPAPYVQNALASLANSIAALYAHGARRFLLLNVPNLARAPSVRLLDQQAPGAGALATQLSQVFNAGLPDVVQYANGLGGANARVLDIHALLEEIVASPGTYGFQNATDACVTPDAPPFQCGQPDTYVFWDGVHPTQAVHALIAQRAIAVINAP
ncbi:MAG TPA: SGNH/GDSL hydrolase family protein [Ramlibacter sp.]|nr:SGNH/GDSL hydrolase family protein [Ramlibacter sp.]